MYPFLGWIFFYVSFLVIPTNEFQYILHGLLELEFLKSCLGLPVHKRFGLPHAFKVVTQLDESGPNFAVVDYTHSGIQTLRRLRLAHVNLVPQPVQIDFLHLSHHWFEFVDIRGVNVPPEDELKVFELAFVRVYLQRVVILEQRLEAVLDPKRTIEACNELGFRQLRVLGVVVQMLEFLGDAASHHVLQMEVHAVFDEYFAIAMPQTKDVQLILNFFVQQMLCVVKITAVLQEGHVEVVDEIFVDVVDVMDARIKLLFVVFVDFSSEHVVERLVVHHQGLVQFL